ncbi:hypothetical protein [Roseovarius sp. A-2]|uniref:hypothetical protein n=1 Tax=Roseovarius sp. A-2 TaxID=1570360 RepID=UPI00111A4A9C|nr:hypothetical protein [Roseovarius sp. A-2]
MKNPIKRPGLLALMLVLLMGLIGPGTRAAEDGAPRAGLMWNRTGLPAVFPLQVKSPPGRDYFLRLIEVETGDAALAAYIEGGAFFRVLVPPGTFRLIFAAGTGWRGEDDLFGPGEATQVFELRRPLTFETRGLDTKAGHIVRLIERPSGEILEAAVKGQAICQRFRLSLPMSIHSEQTRTRHFRHNPGHIGLSSHDVSRLGPRLADPLRNHDRFHRSFAGPRRDVRSRYCG